MKRLATCGLITITTGIAAGCAVSDANDPRPVVRYVGSSTIANFLREAEGAYGRVRFILDTEPESVGGELAIVQGRTDLAGVAGQPRKESLEGGIVASLLGRDAIAVVVHPSNPVDNLTRQQLKDIFTGGIANWQVLGGLDIPIRPYIVGPASATRKVFRSTVLGESDYSGCEVVRPDAEMPDRIGSDPGGIGQISLSFLGSNGATKVLGVDGHRPDSDAGDYPITRPLYLLWWSGRARIAEFIAWTNGAQARAILRTRFMEPKPHKP